MSYIKVFVKHVIILKSLKYVLSAELFFMSLDIDAGDSVGCITRVTDQAFSGRTSNGSSRTFNFFAKDIVYKKLKHVNKNLLIECLSFKL